MGLFTLNQTEFKIQFIVHIKSATLHTISSVLYYSVHLKLVHMNQQATGEALSSNGNSCVRKGFEYNNTWELPIEWVDIPICYSTHATVIWDIYLETLYERGTQ